MKEFITDYENKKQETEKIVHLEAEKIFNRYSSNNKLDKIVAGLFKLGFNRAEIISAVNDHFGSKLLTYEKIRSHIHRAKRNLIKLDEGDAE